MNLSFWNNRSLLSQLTITMATLIAIAVIVITSLYVNREQINVRRELQRQAETTLIVLEATQSDALYLFNIDDIKNSLEALSESDRGVQASVFDDGGRLLADSEREQNLVFSVDADPFALEVLESGELVTRWTDENLEVGREIAVVGESIGVISVRISTATLRAGEQIALQQGFFLALIGVGLGLVVSLLISRAITRPLKHIAEVAQHIEQGDMSKRVDIMAQNEIGQLATTFNGMLTTIQQRDIERLKFINDLETARLEAEENSRLKSEFLSTMSHELRTPLNAIEGFTSIMLSGMGIELSPKAGNMVERISANSKRLLQLINDFLDLSRIESGRLDLVKSPICPVDLAERWRNQVGVLAEDKGVEFVINVSDDLPFKILGDEDALSKIAINLLGNAFKFTSEGQVTLDLSVQNKQWSISVNDTGIGIPPHAQEYIFDEFRQVDGSSKRLYGGTGLGLSLVQKLSRAMGGNVKLESEVGVGSTFTVTLPLELVQEEKIQGVAS